MTIFGANLAAYAPNYAAFFDPAKMRVDEVRSVSDSAVRFFFTPLNEQVPYGLGGRWLFPEGSMVFNLSGGGQSDAPVVGFSFC